MATTWAVTKTLVKAKIRYDGASVEDVNDLAINSGFDTRAKASFYSFVEETFCIYANRSALTLAASDQEVDLFDAAKCAQPIHSPRHVWVNNVKLELWSMADLESMYSGGTMVNGTPVAWALAEDGRICFDKPASGAFANNYVSGWRRHTAIAADGDVLRVPDRVITTILVSYIAADFQMPVVASNAGLNRLEMYDKIAFQGLQKFKAMNLARFHGGAGATGGSR